MFQNLRRRLAEAIAPKAAAPGTASTPGNPNPLQQPTIHVVASSYGGFILCQSAQPEFNKTVLVLFGSGNIGMGSRTPEIDPVCHQEKWLIVSPAKPSGGIVGWRPI